MMRLLRSVKLLDRGLSQVRYLLPVGHRVSNMARGRWLVGRPLARHYARMRVPVVAPPQTMPRAPWLRAPRSAPDSTP